MKGGVEIRVGDSENQEVEETRSRRLKVGSPTGPLISSR